MKISKVRETEKPKTLSTHDQSPLLRLVPCLRQCVFVCWNELNVWGHDAMVTIALAEKNKKRYLRLTVSSSFHANFF